MIYKPLRSAIATIIFLGFFLVILKIITPPLNLYVSLRDSIVEMGKVAHIVIKKKNELLLYIGHSDSTSGLKEDNYEISWQGKDGFVTVWFGIGNFDKEEIYKSARLFIQFIDENRKVDGKDGGDGGWVKFKENHFNYGIIEEILPLMVVQTNSIAFKFPEKEKYPFRYVLYAEGYKPKSGYKTIIVK